ncbi:phage/plasmid primase, P4 family [Mesorhizobium sp.]|uniref:DNA primase family protein n=1 Tax=Mesorhizobium sp. TaxID=1871066 RepID=UPI0025D6BAD7|nr:DNA primase family protein [Mesorhizobium sp.]
MKGATKILQLVDDAPAFDDAAASAETSTAIDNAVRQFGLAELDAELAKVRASEGDGRSPALAAAAEAIGQLVAAGALHDGFARAALEDAAAATGLVRDLKLRAVKSAISAALKAGQKQPRDLGKIRREAAGPKRRPRPAAVRKSSSSAAAVASSTSSSSSSAAVSPAPPAEEGESKSSQTGASASTASTGGTGGGDRKPRVDETERRRNLRLAFFPLTDLGNAERFRERYRDRLLWCPAVGWLAWDGKRWSRDGADDLVKIAEHDTVRAIQDEADEVRESGIEGSDEGGRDFIIDGDDDDPVMYSHKIAKWGRMSEAIGKLGALSKRGAPYLAISIDKLDADKMKINVNNGTLVVNRRAEGDVVSFQEHDPADLITKIAPVDYDKNAPCPEYDKFLQRVQPSAEMRAFIHQWLGLSMTGDVSEQKLAYFYGKGGNGKSVLVDACSHIVGDYGETVPIETFLDHGKSRGAGQATPDLAILPGVRMLRTSEPEKNSKLAEAMVKLVTGGEPIQARHLNRDFFKFYPQFKLTMSGNYRPTISGTDEGIWRRLRLVPFNVSIPKEERDTHLPEKLRAEASGILNRLLDGLRSWCDKGLIEPDEVTLATAEYRSSSDSLGRFLSSCVADAAGERVQSSVLHQVYEAWCKSSGETAWKNKGFTMAMEDRGYKRKQSDVMWFLDIKLIRHVSDFIDNDGNPVKVTEDGVKQEVTDPGDVPF